MEQDDGTSYKKEINMQKNIVQGQIKFKKLIKQSK